MRPSTTLGTVRGLGDAQDASPHTSIDTVTVRSTTRIILERAEQADRRLRPS